jgi:hypothetical protein
MNSLSKNEPLYGSSPKTDLWIALEYPRVPGESALKESALPEEIKAHLTKLQKNYKHSRLVLIRNENTDKKSTRSLFVAYSNRDYPCLYEIPLSDYGELAYINDSALQSATFTLPHHLVKEPLFLICTNGKRDLCCAMRGLPVYNTLSKNSDASVWQTSHVGGHRFAGNMICLPYGIYYGRVTPEVANTIVEHYRAGVIDLDNYRGRATFPGVAQAGEYFLRRQTMDMQLDAYKFTTTMEINPGKWEVIFSSNTTKKHFQLQIDVAQSDERIFESCSTPDDLKAYKQYRLIRYKEIDTSP